MKKFLFLIIFVLLFSCGKKGDHVYVDPDKKVEKSLIFNVKI